mmetsp:Transcript_27999/g.86609  ORF Transcript_27999/g.86609 Transcript_27999/m.86609 type:complete len:241 (-) Transcript_27999:18-740(-)
MLISTQRSGTHFLMHEVRKNRAVHTYDEIFYRYNSKKFSVDQMRSGIEMFFGARSYKPGVIDGRFGWAEKLKSRAYDKPGVPDARGGTIQYNQGPMAYWYTFAETMERLDVSVIHLIRRDIIRAEISHYFLNNKNRPCVPQDKLDFIFKAALQRQAQVRRMQDFFAKTKTVRSLEVDYEDLLADRENFKRVYEFLGLEFIRTNESKTEKLHPTDIPWYDYVYRLDPATGKQVCPWKRKKA